jgi:hypothetical protein
MQSTLTAQQQSQRGLQDCTEALDKIVKKCVQATGTPLMGPRFCVIFSTIKLSHSPISGFGGLEVACWPLVSKFAGSHPAEAIGFSGRKNPQHTFLRRGSKAVGPTS